MEKALWKSRKLPLPQPSNTALREGCWKLVLPLRIQRKQCWWSSSYLYFPTGSWKMIIDYNELNQEGVPIAADVIYLIEHIIRPQGHISGQQFGICILFYSNQKRGAETDCISRGWTTIFTQFCLGPCLLSTLGENIMKNSRLSRHPTEYHPDVLQLSSPVSPMPCL